MINRNTSLVNITKRAFPRKTLSVVEQRDGFDPAQNPFMMTEAYKNLLEQFFTERMHDQGTFIGNLHEFEVYMKDYNQTKNKKFDLT